MLIGPLTSFLSTLFPASRLHGSPRLARSGRPRRLRLRTDPVSCQLLEERCLLTDTTPPVCSVTSPNSGTYNVGETVTISGTASDDSGTIAGTTYKLMKDGSLREFIDVTSNGLLSSYDWRIDPQASGSYQIEMDVTDPSGNVGKSTSGSFNIVADTTPPTAHFDSPQSGTYNVGDTIHMTATGSDNDSIVGTTYTLWQNNEQVAYLDSTATYTPSFDWPIPNKIGSIALGGTYQLRVQFEDPSANITSDFSDGNIVIGGGDSTPPTVTLTNPDSGTFSVGNTITLTGTASDANGINYTTYELWKGGFFFGSIYSGGFGSGLVSSYNWTIPASISGSTITTGSDYQIKMIVGDPSNNSSSDFSNSNLTIQATSSSDTTPPTVTLTAPNSGSFAVGQTINITGTASDANGIDHTYYELWEGASFIGYISTATGLETSYSWLVPAVLNGHTLNATDYQIRMEVADPSGNVNTDLSDNNITIVPSNSDTTPPTVTLTSPNTGSFTVGQTISITGTASDANGIDRTYYELWEGASFIGYIYAGSTGTGLTSSYSWLIPAVLNGHTLNATDYQIRMEVYDPSGNVNTDLSDGNISIVPGSSDTTPPTVTLTSPNSGSFAVGQTINITGTASDANGIDHTRFELFEGATFLGFIYDGATGTGLKTSYSWLVPAVFNGHTLNATDYQLRMEVSDPSGNTNNDLSDGTISITQTADTTPPVIYYAGPNGGSYTVGQTITITGTASDASGIDRTSYELWRGNSFVGIIYQGASGSGFRSSFSWTISSTIGGGQILNGSDYYIKMIVWDLSGNFSADFSNSNITIYPSGTTTLISLVRTSPTVSLTNSTTLVYTATFSQSVTGVDISDFRVHTTGSVTISKALVISGSGSVYTITISGISGTGSLWLTLIDNFTIRNSSGKLLTVFDSDSSFKSAVSIITGGAPRSVVAGDVSRDGRVDLVIANSTSDTVSVLLGNGNGTFAAARNFSTGVSPYSVIIADFNGDGRPDLAVANYDSNSVSVLLGNGNGTFQAAKNFVTGSNPSAVEAGDVNGDGRIDLAVTNYTSNTVSVLLGNGNGTFQAARNAASGLNPTRVEIADLNGDGRGDLAVSNFTSNTVSVLLGNGNGTFGAARNLTTGSHPSDVEAGDFNGDGRLDLAVANYGGNTVTVFLGNGNGTFSASRNFTVGTHPSDIAVGDVNGDGRLDLAVSNYGSNTLSLLLGNGNGTFSAAKTFTTGTHPSSVFIYDVTGDTRVDLIVSNQASNSLTILFANGVYTGKTTFIDTVAPTIISMNRLSPTSQYTTSSSVTFLVKFSEKVTGVNTNFSTDFSLTGSVSTGATIATPTSSDGGLTWVFVVSNISSSATGTLQLHQIHSTGLHDLAGNPLPSTTFTSQTFTIDHQVPTLKSINRFSPTGQVTNLTSVTFQVTFSETVTGVNTNVSTDFSLTGTAITGAIIGVPTTSNGGLSWFIIVSNISSSASGSLALHFIHNTGIVDLAGNPLPNSTFTSQTYSVDRKAPTGVWSQVVSPTSTAADGVIITFSEAMQNVSLANFTLNGTKISTLSGTHLTAMNGNVYVISGLSPYDATAKTYTVSVASGNTLKDLIGNALGNTPSMSWVMNTSSPAASPSALRSPGVSSAAIAFSTAAPGAVSNPPAASSPAVASSSSSSSAVSSTSSQSTASVPTASPSAGVSGSPAASSANDPSAVAQIDNYWQQLGTGLGSEAYLQAEGATFVLS